ncbi:M1 family aminopeptidase [Wenyingzhuangia sp. 1_MG-2023]|nr:M1 family aminopeptidase [Wenyingzhuangia sp. 1_MG-2023]
MKVPYTILFFILSFSVYSQKNQLTINAKLVPEQKSLSIQQEITYYNHSHDSLQKIVLKNWGNSYKNDNTPLAKRLLEDYKTDFYFSKESDRGSSKIHQLQIDKQTAKYHIPKNYLDIIIIDLDEKLSPKDSLKIEIDYTVKIPDAKFTGNGNRDLDYYLEDWYISPVVYDQQWEMDTHKNLNYQHNSPSDYFIHLKTPVGYHVYSDFETHLETEKTFVNHHLKGLNQTKANLSITFLNSYLEAHTYPSTILTNFVSSNISLEQQKIAMQKMMFFLKDHLKTNPPHQLLIEKKTYDRNPIYELKYLPNKLHPFSDQFKWEAEFFNALSSEYLAQTLSLDQNKDYWLSEGLKVYLFIQYMDTYFPNVKILGRLANIWGIKSMHIAKQDFTYKFSILHQITARENLDQSLNTPLKDLSNFNKKITSPYKAGIGFLFLESYVGKETLNSTIADFIHKNQNRETTAEDFLSLLQKNTSKDIAWFQKEWLNTRKKIDYKIEDAEFEKDSVVVTLKNKRSIQTPVLVYGLKGKDIINKTWVDGFSDLKKIKIKNDSLDKVVLNYENIYPEINNRNNWKNKHPKLFERPLQIKLLKDLNNPRKHQVFLKPEATYNYYDGVILGMSIQNQAFMRKNFEYSIKPTFSTQSKSLTGGFGLDYSIYPENTNIYKMNVGIGGSNYHYTEDLNYNTLAPHFSISFKQKNFRALGQNQITALFLDIDKDVPKGIQRTDEDQYNLFKLDYLYRKNKLIHDYRLNVNTEFASKFSKLNLDFRYRHLTNSKRPLELRFFGGVFLRNHTNSNYFSFNQHTANDYLFELPYLGRSEATGLLSQQYFKAQGGFVSQNNPGFANQWLTSINTSVGIWRWVEAFNNVSLLKNKNHPSHFDYESGIRLNFIPDIFELYFPVYNKEGFVPQQDNYWNTVRFVITLKAQPIVKFLKQQLF